MSMADESAPLVALTAAVAEVFPEHPPYGGGFDDVVPHLTIGASTGDRVELWSGPAAATAPDDSWRRVASYDLG